MADLMVWDLQMYTIDEETGEETIYSYKGDCSFICDYITIDECEKIYDEGEKKKELMQKIKGKK